MMKSPLFRVSSASYGSLFIVILLLLMAKVAFAAPNFGIWIEAEGKVRPLTSKAEFERLKTFLARHRFTDLYCQVYRGGKSWFPSVVADDAPYRQALAEGFDPLAELIQLGAERGFRVHAWLNALRIEESTGSPLLAILGKEVVLRDNYGQSLLEYSEKSRPAGELGKHFQIDTPGIWLDASNESLRLYLIEVIRDLLVAYPNLAGVHLDMIRFPYGLPMKPASSFSGGLEFGYTASAKQAFGKENPRGDDWDAWRRAQVTGVVSTVRSFLTMFAPEKVLSAAVLAWPDRAYQNAFQDWRDWLERGLIDVAVPMAYTKDVHLASYLGKQAVAFRNGRKVYVGLGAWLFLSSPQIFVRQAHDALAHNADGIVLFSYANLASAQGDTLVRMTEEEMSSGSRGLQAAGPSKVTQRDVEEDRLPSVP